MKLSSAMGRSIFALLLCFLQFTILISATDSAEQEQEDPCIFVNAGEGVYHSTPIRDTVSGVVETIQTYNVKNVTMDNQYLKADFSEKTGEVVISTKPEFAKYEEIEVDDHFIAKITYICENNILELQYYQRVEDTNNHAPEFDKKEYNFVFYDYLPEKFDLTEYSYVAATDLDISTDFLLFVMEQNEDFAISHGDSKEGKKQFAKVWSKKEVVQPYDKTFTITVYDSFSGAGSDTKSSTAKINIKVLPSDATIEFEAKSYEYSLNGEEFAAEKEISLTIGIDRDIELKFKDSTYSKYFSAYIDMITNTIGLKLNQALPEAPKQANKFLKEIPLKLHASWKGHEAEAEITIKTDKEIALLCIVPSVDLHSSRKDNFDALSDDFRGEFFKISNIENVEAMSCNVAPIKYLHCNFDKSKGEFTIATTEEFEHYEENEVETSIHFDWSIKCPYETKNIEFVQYLKDVNNHEPIFDQTEYNFVFYDELPAKYELTKMQTIQVHDYDLMHQNCHFKFAGSFEADANMLKIEESSKVIDKTCLAKLVAGDQAILAPFDTQYTLVVEDDKNPKKSTNVNVRVQVIKNENQEKFAFTHEEYVLKINKERRTVSQYMDRDSEMPALINGIDSATSFTIPHGVYAEKFKVIANQLTGTVDVTLKKNTQIDSLPDVVSMPIKAMWKGMECMTTIVIVVNGDYDPSSSTTESSGTGKPTTPPTSTAGPGPAKEEGQVATQFAAFNSYLLLTTIGVVTMVVLILLSLIGMLIVTRKIFYQDELPQHVVAQ